MDRFLLMHSFARVVETGSFSAVAREMGTGQPNISRHIAALDPKAHFDAGRRALLQSDEKCYRCDYGGRVDRSRQRCPAGAIARGVSYGARPFPYLAPNESDLGAVPGNGNRLTDWRSLHRSRRGGG